MEQSNQLRALDFAEASHPQSDYHHHHHHHHHYHHHLEDSAQISRLYWRMTGGLVLTSGLLFGSCVFCKLITTRDVLLASLTTLLLWTCVSLFSRCRTSAELDLTGPRFLNGCLTPVLLFILYLLLWLGYCRCSRSSSNSAANSKTKAQGFNAVGQLEQHLVVVTALEVLMILSIVLIISQWLSGRSRHLLTSAACRPYSLLLLFWCLLLLEALLLLLVIFIRRQTSSAFSSDHHSHHSHHHQHSSTLQSRI